MFSKINNLNLPAMTESTSEHTSLAQACLPEVATTLNSFVALASGNPYAEWGGLKDGTVQEVGRNSDNNVSIKRGQSRTWYDKTETLYRQVR